MSNHIPSPYRPLTHKAHHTAVGGRMMLGWHFTSNTLRDGRPLPPDGETLVHDGALRICKSGFHASRRLIDALDYAPGHIIHRVEVAGPFGDAAEHNDKVVAARRTILWRIDGEAVLRAFTRRCAFDVVHLWGAPEIVLRYLRTGDDSLRNAAYSAACSAASSAASSAAYSAASNAADSTAYRAAYSAANSAAYYAANSAAYSAADSTAYRAAYRLIRDAQNRRLISMVVAEHRRQSV